MNSYEKEGAPILLAHGVSLGFFAWNHAPSEGGVPAFNGLKEIEMGLAPNIQWRLGVALAGDPGCGGHSRSLTIGEGLCVSSP